MRALREMTLRWLLWLFGLSGLGVGCSRVRRRVSCVLDIWAAVACDGAVSSVER